MKPAESINKTIHTKQFQADGEERQEQGPVPKTTRKSHSYRPYYCTLSPIVESSEPA